MITAEYYTMQFKDDDDCFAACGDFTECNTCVGTKWAPNCYWVEPLDDELPARCFNHYLEANFTISFWVKPGDNCFRRRKKTVTVKLEASFDSSSSYSGLFIFGEQLHT